MEHTLEVPGSNSTRRRSIVFRTGADDSATESLAKSQQHRSRTDSTIQLETVLELIKSPQAGHSSEKREDLARRLSAASQKPNRRVSTIAVTQLPRRSGDAAQAENQLMPQAPQQPHAGGEGGPRYMSVATRYRLAAVSALTVADIDSTPPPPTPPKSVGGGNARRVTSAGKNVILSSSTQHLSSNLSARGVSPLVLSAEPPKTKFTLSPTRPNEPSSPTSPGKRSSVHGTARLAVANPTSRHARREQLLKKGVIRKEESDSSEDDLENSDPSSKPHHLQQLKEEDQLLMLKQLTARSLSTVTMNSISLRITGAVRSHKSQPLTVAQLRKRLAAGLLQQILNSNRAAPNLASAVKFSGAFNIDSDWIRTILRKPKAEGKGGVLAEGDAGLVTQVEWVLCVDQQIAFSKNGSRSRVVSTTKAPASSISSPSTSLLHPHGGTVGHQPQLVAFAPTQLFMHRSSLAADDNDENEMSASGPFSQPQHAKSNMTEVFKTFSFGDRGGAHHAGNHHWKGRADDASSDDSDAPHKHHGAHKPKPQLRSVRQVSVVHSEAATSDGDTDDDEEAERASFSSSASDSFRKRQDADKRKRIEDDEEDLPLDTIRPVAKHIGDMSLMDAVAFHRGRFGNASSRMPPMEFVGATNENTPRTFRLGHNRGRRSPRVSPVTFAISKISTPPSGGGNVNEDCISVVKSHAMPATRKDVDDFVANIVHDVPLAHELRSLLIHHTPLSAKQVARLTFGAFAAMPLKFLQRIALRFCELDGVSVLPLVAWLAVDTVRGPAGLHTLDLADNNLSAKDLPLLAAAICGTQSLVSLSIRNNPLFLYYEEAQERINAEYQEAMRVFLEARKAKQRGEELSVSRSQRASPRAAGSPRGFGRSFVGSLGIDVGEANAARGKNLQSSVNTARTPRAPPNPETPPHQLIATFMTSLHQLEHLDLGFCGLTDTSVVKVCNFLHEPDCRLKFLNIDGATITVSVSALLLDTVKRHCRTILDLSVRYVYFCSGPQFLKKLCNTLRRRVWHLLKESGVLEEMKRTRHGRKRTSTVVASPSSPDLPMRRGTLMRMSTPPSSPTLPPVSTELENEDRFDDADTTQWVSLVHTPLERVYLRHRALERWCDAKLEHRAKIDEDDEKRRMLSDRGTVGSMGNLSEIRSTLSMVHRQHDSSGGSTTAGTPRWLGGANRPTPRAMNAPTLTFDAINHVDSDDEESKSNANDATEQPQAERVARIDTGSTTAGQTPRNQLSQSSSANAMESSSVLFTPRGAVAFVGEGSANTVEPMSSPTSRVAHKEMATAELARMRSIKIPLPLSRPRWERSDGAPAAVEHGNRQSAQHAGAFDDNSDISSNEPVDEGADDFRSGTDVLAMDDVDDDMMSADDWGGWNLAGLRRGYGGYTTNDPSLVSRVRRRKRRGM